jgi:hypothetical protein
MSLTPETSQIIYMHPSAPRKPPEGEPCNGCGVCCLAQPCPLGVLLSAKTTGACHALRWVDAGGHYRCGAITAPHEVLQAALPSVLPTGLRRGAAMVVAPLLQRLARRWIAAGAGCDSSLEPLPTRRHI